MRLFPSSIEIKIYSGDRAFRNLPVLERFLAISRSRLCEVVRGKVFRTKMDVTKATDVQSFGCSSGKFMS
jgi:hypothetical protein